MVYDVKCLCKMVHDESVQFTVASAVHFGMYPVGCLLIIIEPANP